MVAHDSKVEAFTEFVTEHETRLRESLIAACGGEVGRDAARFTRWSSAPVSDHRHLGFGQGMICVGLTGHYLNRFEGSR